MTETKEVKHFLCTIYNSYESINTIPVKGELASAGKKNNKAGAHNKGETEQGETERIKKLFHHRHLLLSHGSRTSFCFLS